MGHKEWCVASLISPPPNILTVRKYVEESKIWKERRARENWDEAAKSEGNNGYKSNCLAEDKIFSSPPPPPFFLQSDSCLTESDKAERSWWRQAPQYVEFCLPGSKRKKRLLPRPSRLPDQSNGAPGRPGEIFPTCIFTVTSLRCKAVGNCVHSCV